MVHRVSFLILCWLLIAIGLSTPSLAKSEALISVPVRDLSSLDFAKTGAVALDQAWGFEWQGDESGHKALALVDVPNNWPSYGMPGQGRAVYHLTLELPLSGPPLALQIEGVYSSYELFINNKTVARGGQFRFEVDSQRYKNISLVELPANSSRLDLRLEVENNVHAYGGMRRSIIIDTKQALVNKRIVSDALMLFLMGACAALGIHYLILFIRRPSEIYYGIFAACGFLFAVKEIILYWQLGFYLPVFSPLNYTWLVRAEYWVTFLPLVLYYAFLRSLYPVEHPAWLAKVIYVYVGLFLLTCLFTPSVFFTGVFKYFLIGALSILMAVFVCSIQTFRNKRPAANWLFATYLIIFIVNAHDSLLYMDIIVGGNISKYGHLFLLLGLSALLGKRMQISLEAANLLSAELSDRVKSRTQELSDKVIDLKEARQEADHANRAKSSFLAAASHDLRQPMHSLGLLLDNLESEIARGTHTSTLDSIERSVASLNTMFAALLDISKLDSGVVEATKLSVHLKPLFAQLNEEFQAALSDRPLALVFVDREQVVLSDPILLLRVLRNLISNAIKHTQKGQILVSAEQASDMVEISVSDTGCGIPYDELENVFKEFYQLANPERNSSKGLGLGLSIVRKLSALLGHKISVTSELGGGSRFSLILEQGSAIDLVAVNEPPLNYTKLHGVTVLIIDDDEQILMATAKLLDSWGCHCLMASNQHQALALVEDQDIDMLITDYRLENDQSGLELAARVLATLLAPVPVIVMTGDTGKGVLDAVKASGYLIEHKPMKPNELKNRLLKLV